MGRARSGPAGTVPGAVLPPFGGLPRLLTVAFSGETLKSSLGSRTRPLTSGLALMWRPPPGALFPFRSRSLASISSLHSEMLAIRQTFVRKVEKNENFRFQGQKFAIRRLIHTTEKLKSCNSNGKKLISSIFFHVFDNFMCWKLFFAKFFTHKINFCDVHHFFWHFFQKLSAILDVRDVFFEKSEQTFQKTLQKVVGCWQKSVPAWSFHVKNISCDQFRWWAIH
jgi:hypothetical protein